MLRKIVVDLVDVTHESNWESWVFLSSHQDTRRLSVGVYREDEAFSLPIVFGIYCQETTHMLQCSMHLRRYRHRVAYSKDECASASSNWQLLNSTAALKSWQ